MGMAPGQPSQCGWCPTCGSGDFITSPVVLLPWPTQALTGSSHTILSPPAELLKASACGWSAPCPPFLSWDGTQLPHCLLSSWVLLTTSDPQLSPSTNPPPPSRRD